VENSPLIISPNPMPERAFLILPNNTQTEKLELYNSSGQLIYQWLSDTSSIIVLERKYLSPENCILNYWDRKGDLWSVKLVMAD